MNNTVHVCPSRDIECGHNSSTWCSECPKWFDLGGMRVVENPTLAPNEMKVTPPSFAEAEGRAKNREFHNRAVLGHPGSSESFVTQMERMLAFEKVRRLVNGPDLDGVLAKIRQLVNDCP